MWAYQISRSRRTQMFNIFPRSEIPYFQCYTAVTWNSIRKFLMGRSRGQSPTHKRLSCDGLSAQKQFEFLL